jgi:hypothetical protein
VYGGLEYYRQQVADMASGSGDQAIDAGKRDMLANLLREIRLRPVKGTRELEAEFGLGAAALPAVMCAGSANAYIVVAGACFVLCRQCLGECV